MRMGIGRKPCRRLDLDRVTGAARATVYVRSGAPKNLASALDIGFGFEKVE